MRRTNEFIPWPIDIVLLEQNKKKLELEKKKEKEKEVEVEEKEVNYVTTESHGDGLAVVYINILLYK